MIKQSTDHEPGLERFISYLLMAGVTVSLILEITGIVLFYRTYGNLQISQQAAMFVQGHDFFSFVFDLATGRISGAAPLVMMTAGVIILLLTPLLRVIASVVYFVAEKNFKYVIITLVVLVILVVSLSLH